MSGPTPDKQIWQKEPTDLITRSRIRRLRTLADRVERWEEWNDMDEAPFIAELLRAKADKIEAARRTIECETRNDDFQTLIKAVEWCDTGDYAPSAVKEAWDEYAEPNDGEGA